MTCFTAAYAIGLLGIGKIIDIIGTKIGYAFALTGWSLAAIGHAFARTVFGFGFARFGLGLFEAGKNSVNEIFVTGDSKAEFVCYENGSVIAYVHSKMGYPAIYPMLPARSNGL